MKPFKEYHDVTSFIESALTGRGSAWMSKENTIKMVEAAHARGYGIQSMEVQPADESPIKGWRMDHGIFGLDGEDDWEKHYDIDRALGLFQRKLELAEKEGRILIYQVWIAPTK